MVSGGRHGNKIALAYVAHPRTHVDPSRKG
jgi:hypothetical protein